MDLIKSRASSSPESSSPPEALDMTNFVDLGASLVSLAASRPEEPSSPPEALREPPRPHERPDDLELSLVSPESAVSESKAFGPAPPPAACSTPDAGLEASIGGGEVDDESVRSGTPGGHTPYPHKRGVAPRRLFKRARSSEDAAATASGSPDSSLLMLPPPPPFNSPEEGCAATAMPGGECDYTPRTKARKLRAALETVAATSASASEEGPEEALRGADVGSPQHGMEELSVSVPAEGESTANGDGEDDIL